MATIGAIIDGVNTLSANDRHEAITELVFALLGVQGCAASAFLKSIPDERAIREACENADRGIRRASMLVQRANDRAERVAELDR